jgi:hypothetical protein
MTIALRQEAIAGDQGHHGPARGFDHDDAVVKLDELMALHERDVLHQR